MVAFRIETLTPEQLCRLNSTIWAHHHIIAMSFVFVLYCSVNLLCVLVIVVYVWFVHQKLQRWLAICFGLDKKLQPAYSTQETSYSLLSPDISQVSTFPRENQITTASILLTLSTAHILQTGTNMQPAFSRQNQSTARIFQTGTKVQSAFSRPEPKYSLHSPDRNQSTACIL